MRNSVVNIKSVSNNAFGTGFVIDFDDKGVYILTCQHVLDDVETPVVENVLAKVIAKGTFIDMAVLYVSKLHLDALPLQTKNINNLHVEVIGFSTFNKTLTQKKHIKATLYEESIELHSKESDDFYTVRKIKANDGFIFDRGNSGSPVICKSSSTVIAMISNKEGSDIAYAIDIENLKTVWKDVSERLFKAPPIVIKQASHKKEVPKPPAESEDTNSFPIIKYGVSFLLIISFSFGVYNMFSKPPRPIIKPPIDKPAHIEKERLKRIYEAK